MKAANKRPEAASCSDDQEDKEESETQESVRDKDEEATWMRNSQQLHQLRSTELLCTLHLSLRSYKLEWHETDGRMGTKLRHGKRRQLFSF